MINIPIYWINLNNRNDRRIQMIEQFEKLNISNHIRIEARDDLKAHENCIHSHFKAIKTAYIDDCDMALIVEDDINLKNIFKLNYILNNLPNNWECLQVHYIEPLLLEYLTQNEKKNCLIEGYFMSAACYLINRKGMQKLLNFVSLGEELKPNFSISENGRAEEFVFRYINTYTMLYPILNTNENFKSNIPQSDMNLAYKNMLLIDALHSLFRNEKIDKIIKIPYDRHFFTSTQEIIDEINFE